MFGRKKSKPPIKKAVSAFTTDVFKHLGRNDSPPTAVEWEQPTLNGVAADSSLDGTVPSFKGGFHPGIPEAQASWYASQGFIGYNMCALIAKHWLVDKACSMPARDAVRQGYRLDGEGDIERLEKEARQRNMNATMRDYVATGRRFGGAAALFVVESTDPEYYEKRFNPDGVTPGSYKGIKIIEPSWMVPDLVADNVQDPASLNFCEPSFWLIGGRRYHKSHFCFFVPYPVANLAKHTYRYFGVSVPERLYERVYAAERTANEAPQLAMTKRLLTMGIPDLGGADKDVIAENMAYFVELRNNYGVNVSDADTNFQQFDTSLADLETVINSQYRIVAAAAMVPAAKLMGDSPAGSLNATGEHESESYRQELESVQTNDLEPLLNRHFEVLARSLSLGEQDIDIVWNPLDSPTAAEYAQISLQKAQAAQAYANVGAVDGTDIRKQLASDPESEWYGLEDEEVDLGSWLGEEDPPAEQPGEAASSAEPASSPLETVGRTWP